MMDELSARPPAATFAVLLRRLRIEARLTQEELAEASGLSARSISDLERGVSRTARRETARLLADALAMSGPVRTAFVAAARGKAPVSEVLATMAGSAAGPPQGAALSNHHQDLGFALHDAKLGQLIDAIASTACRGCAVARIWLLGLIAVGQTAPSRPDAVNPGAARTGRVGQPVALEPARLASQLADQAWPPLGPALDRALAEAVAMLLTPKAVVLGDRPGG